MVNELQGGIAEFWEWRSTQYAQMYPEGQPFNTKAQFQKLLENAMGPLRNQRSIWIFAHNMDFDYQVMDFTGEMTSRGWRITKTIMEAPPFMVSMTHGTNGNERTLRFVDSMNWFRMPLRDLAKPLGMHKMEDAGVDAPWEEREAYCRNDVAILREAIFAWIKFCKVHDLGMFAISQAAQALGAFRHRFMKQEIFVNHDEKVATHERAAYIGSRTEARWMGHHRKAAHLDVNSLYPSVMRGGLYPTKLVAQYEKGDLSTLYDALDRGMGCVASVTLTTSEPWYPKKGERVIFPVGTFETTLCTPELKRAREYGHIVGVGRIQVYQMGEIFTEFVEYFYAQRIRYKEEGNDPFQLMCKIFLNSLYGKFGQMSPEWEEVTDPDELVGLLADIPPNRGRWDTNEGTFRRVGDHVERKVGRVEAYNAFCAIAAHVTSAARMVLLDGMLAAGMNEVYYVDTDSIFCSQEGKARMSDFIDPSKLGAWKDEGDVSEFFVYGAKDYVMDGVPRRKGVRASATEWRLVTPLGEPSHFEQDMFRSYVGAMGAGHAGEQRVITIRKHLSREYRKGIVTVSGKVLPIILDVGG
ncbi:MAG: DNA polymerase [Pseudonocardiaceae bacterium]